MNPRLACRCVIPPTQARLLRLLATFPKSLEDAWDVPRDLSLPGLAEQLGVVRSALNPPLTTLEKGGLVAIRPAHVIGGGHRKRKVVHITDDGRQAAEGLEDEVAKPAAAVGELFGDAPAPMLLHGRAELLDELAGRLEDGCCLQIEGFAGIGKTCLLRALAAAAVNSGWTVRWATLGATDDATSLAARWLGLDDAHQSTEAALAALAELPKRTLLVVDELQDAHPRHLDGVLALLDALAESPGSGLLVASRAPTPLDAGEVVRLEELESGDARNLLSEALDDDEAEAVLAALGGHPLALKLWEPGDSLPEADDRVQAFIQSDVIERVAADVLPALDELAAAPWPLYAEQMAKQDGVDALDEAALLRWQEELLELQHLVRNVRRTMWSDDERRAIHVGAAEHWAGREEPKARLHEAHHRIQAAAEDDADALIEHLEEGSGLMLSLDSAAMAALVHDALRVLPDAGQLKLLSARVALERGELELAEQALSEAEEAEAGGAEWAMLAARLARVTGEAETADRLEQEAIEKANPGERVKLEIGSLAARFDDHLPRGERSTANEELHKRLEGIDLSTLDQRERRRALVALALLRHALALEGGDLDAAADVRQQLQEAASADDPLVLELAARAALAQGSPAQASDMLEAIHHPLRRIALGLRLVESLSENDPSEAASLLQTLPAPTDLGSNAARRLSALHWFWQGQLDEGQRIRCWQEAIHRFQTAECPRAAAELTSRLHTSLFR